MEMKPDLSTGNSNHQHVSLLTEDDVFADGPTIMNGRRELPCKVHPSDKHALYDNSKLARPRDNYVLV